jgi:hypothetical protein
LRWTNDRTAATANAAATGQIFVTGTSAYKIAVASKKMTKRSVQAHGRSVVQLVVSLVVSSFVTAAVLVLTVLEFVVLVFFTTGAVFVLTTGAALTATLT